ncbi:MAG: universal stress protein [Desulfohalobiaceae bacterium]
MYKHILLPVDLQEEEDSLPRKAAMQRAVELSRFYQSQLHVLTVVPDLGMPIVGQYFPADSGSQIIQDAENALHSFLQKKIPGDIWVQHMVAQGSIYRRIIEMAEEVQADLIIMPANRTKFRDYLLGTNTARVVRHAQCSVLVVRELS